MSVRQVIHADATSRSVVRNAVALLLFAGLVFGLSACGNRNSIEELQVATSGGSGSLATGPAAPVVNNESARETPAEAVMSTAPPTGGIANPDSLNKAQPAGVPQVTGTGSSAARRGGTSAAGGNQAACTGALAPVRIGSIGEISGVLGATFGPGPKALQAWGKWINLRGGIDCHPVEVFVADDGGDPATHQALAQQFVEQDHVVAFVYMTAPLAGGAGVNYLKSHGIPVFGSEGGSDWFNENPNYFPQMSSGGQYVELTFAMAGRVLGAKGLTKIATVACLEAPICSSAYTRAEELASKFGLTSAYRAQVSLTQPNFTSTCLSARDAGAQVVFLGLDGNSDRRFARDCARVGYKPRLVTPGVGITPDAASAPEVAGIEVGLPVVPWTSVSVPAIADLNAALATFAPGVPATSAGVAAWTAAQVLTFAVQNADGDITSRSLMQAAFRVKNNTFGGLTQPLTYKANAPSHKQPLCWWAAEFNGTTVTSPNGGKMTCE